MTQEKIAIVTDSTCDLNQDYLDSEGIRVLSLRIIYPEGEFRDRIDIQPEEIYSRLTEVIPKTSMPGLGEVLEVFQQLKEEGFAKVISIHVSGGLSSTYETVRSAAANFSDLEVEVIDSKGLSLSMGFLVLEAVKLRIDGYCFTDIVTKLKQARERIGIFFVVKSLEYLKKGGRIGLIEGTLGDFLNLKPIVSINEEGKYYTYAKVRGRRRSLGELADIIRGRIAGKTVNLAVMHGGAEEEGREVRENLMGLGGFSVNETFWGQIGPSMVVHSGPGLIGVAYQIVE